MILRRRGFRLFSPEGGGGGGDPPAAAPPAASPPAPGATIPPPAATPPAADASVDWRTTLPEDLRSHASMAKFTSAEALARSYISAEGMIGRDKIVLPRDANDAEALDRAYAALGRPENADGYTYKPPADLPQGVVFDEGLLKTYAAAAHKHGLNQTQFEGVAGMFLDHLTQGASAAATASEAALKQGEGLLKREWGERYDTNMRISREAVRSFGGDELVTFLDESGLGNHPILVKAFTKIGAQTVGEEKLLGGARDAALTPANLDAAISDFRSKNAGALASKGHPDHGRLVQELQGLYQRRYPEG